MVALVGGLTVAILIPIGLAVAGQTNQAVGISDSGFNSIFGLLGIVLAGVAIMFLFNFLIGGSKPSNRYGGY